MVETFPIIAPGGATPNATYKVHGVNLGKPYLYDPECPWTNRAKQATLWHEFDTGTGRRVDTYVVSGVSGTFQVGEEVNNYNDPVVSVPGNEWMQRSGTVRAIPNATTLVVDADIATHSYRSLRPGDVIEGQTSNATCTLVSRRGVYGPLDSQGYPTTPALAGTLARSFMCGSATATPIGEWICAWDGGGTVRFDSANGGTANASGYISRTIGSYGGNFTVEIQSGTVTNLRVYFKPYEAYLLGAGVDPDFTVRMADSGVNSLRIMDYQDTNGSVVETWADTKPWPYYTESNLTGEIDEDAYVRRGCSLAGIVGLANYLAQLGILKRLAVCVPHRVWRDPTNSWLNNAIPILLQFQGEHIELEVSNEVWNTFGAISIQTNDFQEAGVNGVPAIGFAARTTISDNDKMNQAYGNACERIFRLAHEIAGAQAARIKRTIAFQATNWTSFYDFRTKTGQDSNVFFPFDHVSPSGYFSNNLGNDHSSATIAGWTPQQFFDYAVNDLNTRVYGAGGNEALAVRAGSDNATITFYETGQHEWFGSISGPALAAVQAWYASALCETFYKDHLCPKLRNTTNSEGHGYHYNFVGPIWGLSTLHMGDQAAQRKYQGYKAAGAVLNGGGGPINRAPTVNNPATQTVAEGASGSVQLTGQDPDNDPLIWSANGSNPAWVTVSPSGLVEWSAPIGSASGSPYTIGFRATDPGNLSATGVFSLVVTGGGGGGGNIAPAINPPLPMKVTEGILSTFQFTLAAGTPPVTWTATGLPNGAVVNTAGLLIAQVTPGFTGTFVVQLTATNAFGVDIKPFLLTVSPNGGTTSIIISITGASKVSLAPVLRENYAR